MSTAVNVRHSASPCSAPKAQVQVNGFAFSQALFAYLPAIRPQLGWMGISG